MRRAWFACVAALGVGVAADASQAWQKRPPSSLTARMGSFMAYDASPGREKVVLFGGDNNAGAYHGDTWEYDASGTWAQVASGGPEARSRGAMAYYPNNPYPGGNIVIYGGIGTAGVFDDTWQWNGTSWTEVCDPCSPAGKMDVAMAYHAGGTPGIILFGGGIGFTNDTWRYTNGGWTALGPFFVKPSVRSAHAMVYDEDRNVVVLFGGDGATGILDDTWEWNGTSWAVPSPALPFDPGARRTHSIVYDTARNRVVMWGGQVSSDIATWEYVPNAQGNLEWILGGPSCSGVCTPTINPPSWPWLENRAHYAAAYHAGRSAAVVFGGYLDAACSGLSGETWEYRDVTVTGVPSLVTGVGTELGATENIPQLRTWPITCTGDNPVTCDFACGTLTNVKAYGPWKYGINVAAGDIGFTGPSGAMPLTGPGPGEFYGPQVKGWKWTTGEQAQKINFFAYGTLRWGVKVATGNIGSCAGSYGCPKQEILTGAGPGQIFGPHVRGWTYDPTLPSGPWVNPMANVSFFAYSGLYYGVNVSSGDVDPDTWDEILTGKGPGPSYDTQVKVFDHDDNPTFPFVTLKTSFIAFPGQFLGATVAGGNIDGDTLFRYDDIVVGPGPHPSNLARVKVFFGPSFTTSNQIDVFDTNIFHGTFVSAGDFGVSKDLVVAGQVGVAASGHATRLRGLYLDTTAPPDELKVINNFHFESYGYNYGTTVAASRDPFVSSFAAEQGTEGERKVILQVTRQLVADTPDSTYACAECPDPSPGIWNVWGDDAQKKLLLDGIDRLVQDLPILSQKEVEQRADELAALAADPKLGLTNAMVLQELLLQIEAVKAN